VEEVEYFHFSLLLDAPGSLSEYEQPCILRFIIVNCRNSNVKDADDKRQRRRLRASVTCIGILCTVIALTAMIISIYLLIIMTQMLTTTTGENKV
jgi:hypothetical protein